MKPKVFMVNGRWFTKVFVILNSGDMCAGCVADSEEDLCVGMPSCQAILTVDGRHVLFSPIFKEVM